MAHIRQILVLASRSKPLNTLMRPGGRLARTTVASLPSEYGTYKTVMSRHKTVNKTVKACIRQSCPYIRQSIRQSRPSKTLDIVVGRHFHAPGRQARPHHSRVPAREREFLSDKLLVRIHFTIVMMRWTGLAPWEFETAPPSRPCQPTLVFEAHRLVYHSA